MANSAGFEQCVCIFPRPFSNAEIVGTIRRVFRTEYLQIENGATYRRQHVCGSNSNEWRKVIENEVVRPMTPPPDKSLWWSASVRTGRIWQVNGDPDVGMRYAHRGPDNGVKMFLTASFADKLLVCDNLSEHWEAKLNKIANTIKAPGPPQSPNVDQPRKIDFQRGTCKTWVWQVLDELVKEGIASSEVAKKARNLPDLEPLD